MNSSWGIYGAGGKGREIYSILRANRCETIYLIDDSSPGGKYQQSQIISYDSFLKLNGDKKIIISISNCDVRKKIAEKIFPEFESFPSIVAPSAFVCSSATIGKSAFISHFCSIQSDVKIGEFFQGDAHCSISHDCQLGHFVTLESGVMIGGNVSIGNNCYIEIGAVIKPKNSSERLYIPDGSRVKKGSVIEESL